MKRSSPPERRTPLRSYTALQPGGELSRSTPLPRTTPERADAVRLPTRAEAWLTRRKPASRDERYARRVVRARVLDGLCEGCAQWPAADYAHRIARSQGGPWCPSNALALCSDLTTPPGVVACHPWSHSRPDEARGLGWMLRRSDDPSAVPAFLVGRGPVLLGVDGSVTPTNRGAA